MSGCTANRVAYKKGKEAFNHVTTAHQMVTEFSEDLYEAWRLGVNEQNKYDDDFYGFAAEMKIDTKYIEQAVANLSGVEEFEEYLWTALYILYNKSYFSAWVSVISEAYECSGDADMIRNELNDAKDLMKKLGSNYSDYEHYPSLKKYFTNTIAFFDFCCNPEGSFEQVVETINTYRNNAREYFFDLNYVFGDSIDGFHSETEDEDEEENEVA